MEDKFGLLLEFLTSKGMLVVEAIAVIGVLTPEQVAEIVELVTGG